MKNYLDGKLTFEEVMTGVRKLTWKSKIMQFFKRFFLVCMCLSFMGCGVFKSERRDIIPDVPKLNYKENEVIKQQAKVNFELAKWIRSNGITPNSERSILLEDGSRVILRYVGQPYEEIDSGNLKEIKKINEKADGVAKEHQKDLAKYDDTLDKYREKTIKETNLKWDLGKIFGGGIITWLAIAVAIPVLSAFFPVIIPFVSIAFQLLKAGFGAFKVVAKLGVSGLVHIVGAVEKFRDANKGTDVGQAFDEHMKKELDTKEKTALDAFKNNFNI